MSIAVRFDLPPQFKFSKKLQAAKTLLGGRTFSIRKEWTRVEPSPSYYLNDDGPLDPQDRQKVDQFLQLITFRYIPNRVLPIDVIRAEHQGLRDVLIRRLGRDKKSHSEAFDAIREKSERLIQALADRFHDAAPDAGNVRLATPTSWNEMVFAFGYKLIQGGVEIEDTAQGSGIQSLLMLETLFLIDRDYFQQFGWRQAALWAVEEPESSLHSSLEARVASYLRSISTEDGGRLQVLCTTHSDLMLQYAKKPVVVEYRDGATTFDTTLAPRAALDRLTRVGVSRWTHPVLHFPLDPLIIVEGKHDHGFFMDAIRLIAPTRQVRIVYLELLADGPQTGGVQELQRYIREHREAIKSRMATAPVIVVLDWESANKRDAFLRGFKEADPFRVLAWPESALNPKLGKSFRGIERAMSDRIIKAAQKNGAPIATKVDGSITVDREEYGSVKDLIGGIVRRGLRDGDLKHARPFVEHVLREAGVLE